jgi:integrase
MGTDARGTYHRETLNTGDTVTANEKMRRIEFGQPVVTRFDLTIAEAWERYKVILEKQRGVKPSSIRTVYNVTMKSLLTYAESRKPPVTKLADINIEFLDQWIGTWDIQPSTRANRYCAICGLFRAAVARKWIPEDPTLLLERPKAIQGGKTQPFDLDTEDGAIIAALPHWESTLQRPRQTYKSPWARNPRTAAALVLVLRYTGLRISDAIRFDPRTLKKATIRGQRMYLYYAPHQRKTDAPVFVPIMAEIAEQIINAPRMCEEYAFWDGKTAEGRWCRTFIPNCLTYLSRVSGVAHIHPHRFRDTFAVDLLSQGADIRSVSRLLGHKNVATTLRYYEHYIPSDQEKLMDVVLKHHSDKAKVIPFAKNA